MDLLLIAQVLTIIGQDDEGTRSLVNFCLSSYWRIFDIGGYMLIVYKTDRGQIVKSTCENLPVCIPVLAILFSKEIVTCSIKSEGGR